MAGLAAAIVFSDSASASWLGAATVGPAWAAAACAALAAVFAAAWRSSVRRTKALEAAYAEAQDALDAERLMTDALTLEGADGVLIWSGGRLRRATGAAAAAETADSPAEVAALISGAKDVAALANALDALVEQGESFSLWVICLDGRLRHAQGALTGGCASVRLRDVSILQHDAAQLRSDCAAARAQASAALAQLESLPIPIWRRDGRGRVCWGNAAYLQAVEARSVNDLQNRNYELTGALGAASLRLLAQRALAEGIPASDTHNIIINGDRRAMRITESPRPDVDGAFGVAIDVEAAVAAEIMVDRLRRAQSELLDRVDSCVAFFDPNLALSHINKGMIKTLNLDETFAASNPRLDEILNVLRESGRLTERADFAKWRKDLMARAADAVDNGAPFQEEWSLSNDDFMHISISKNPLGGMMLVADDVTPLLKVTREMNTAKAVQERALTQLNEGVALFNADGRATFFNKSFTAMWSLADSLALDRPHILEVADMCLELYSDQETWGRVISQISAFRSHRERWTKMLSRNNDSVIEMTFTPLPDGATMLSFVDMTDSYEVQRSLRARNEYLQLAGRVTTGFLRSVEALSQELNTPMQSICLSSEVLGQEMYGPLNEQQMEYADIINIAAGELRTIWSDIIDMAKVASGAVDMEIKEIDVYWALHHVATLAEEKNADLNLPVETSCSRAIGKIPADAERLQQILFTLVNLLMRQGEGQKGVDIIADRENRMVRVRVRPRGHPMPPLLCDAFEAGGLSSDKLADVRGTALKLDLARHLTERHGGQLTIVSDSETEAAFLLTLSTDYAHVEQSAGQAPEWLGPLALDVHPRLRESQDGGSHLDLSDEGAAPNDDGAGAPKDDGAA